MQIYYVFILLIMPAVCMQIPNSLKACLQSVAAGGVRAHRIVAQFVLTGLIKLSV